MAVPPSVMCRFSLRRDCDPVTMLYIEVQNPSVIEIHVKLPDTVRATALGLANRFWEHSRFYGRDGVLWKPSPAAREHREMSRLVRALARTIYNPNRIVQMTYEPVGEYRCQ
jgi:hypothetical protein